jgi:hypothetical protein
MHGDDGTRQHSDASYEGTVYQCLCGERFVDLNALDEHIDKENGLRHARSFQTVSQLAARTNRPSDPDSIPDEDDEEHEGEDEEREERRK